MKVRNAYHSLSLLWGDISSRDVVTVCQELGRVYIPIAQKQVIKTIKFWIYVSSYSSAQ